MRPYEHLPSKHPREFDPSDNNLLFFYENFIKHFIPDMIGIMNAGLVIDKKAVEELRATVTSVLSSVSDRLIKNKKIKKFQNYKLPNIQKKHYDECTKSIRTIKYYTNQYKASNILHRTWVINTYLIDIGYKSKIKDKWTLSDLKQLNIFLENSFIKSVIDRRDIVNNSHTIKGMKKLAEYKLELWNRPRYEKAKKPVDIPEFNPGSPKQLREFFEFCKITPLSYSNKTGEPSWGREQLEIIYKQTTDEDLKDALQSFIDYSYSSIINNNFLKAFDTYTIDGKLHGNIKLFGALSFRPTSNNPNLLNMPSTGSIYAKPLKKCFIAPKGKLVIQADYSSLEDVVLSCLTKDEGKIAIQKDKTLDAHCYNALTYFKDEILKYVDPNNDYKNQVREFNKLVEEGHSELKSIRQKSKPCTFKLAYLGYPDADKGGVITQDIYDNYHNVLYPGVKSYLDDYTIPFVRENGYIHLGLGCRLYCDNVDEKFRSIFNANFQFWSILTLISINEMNYRIKQENLQDDIIIVSTIYDSIYANITADSEIIKWYNDNLNEIGSKDFIEDQPVSNTLTCGIGRSWAEEIPLPVNATTTEIDSILKELV